jgi:cytochrome c oxidase subunit 4
MSHPANEHGHQGALAHVMPKRVLIGVWGALMVLTVLTVTAHSVDFGGNLNLVVALAIATVKATLVVLFFMHLLYDRTFHLLFFLGSLLFVFLFLSFALLDSGQYQGDIAARASVVDSAR